MIQSNQALMSNSLTYVFESQIGQRAKFTANTGIVEVSTGNTNINGSGTTYTLLTPSTNGTNIRKITIKAAQTTTRGMIRFYTVDSTDNLFQEVEIPSVVVGSVDASFEIEFDVNWFISDVLKVSIEESENVVITAEGLDITYP